MALEIELVDAFQTFGIQVTMLLWFMWRLEKIINKNTNSLDEFRYVVQKCRKKNKN